MEYKEWFDYQLQSTLDGLIWAVQQIPEERLYLPPPLHLGEWSAAQHLAHIVEYERRFALPAMSQWLGVPPVIPEEAEQPTQPNPPLVEEKLAQFEQVRWAQINLLTHFAEADWHKKLKTTFWGEVSLYWVVGKTYQHTLEHTGNLLALNLFWDSVGHHPGH